MCSNRGQDRNSDRCRRWRRKKPRGRRARAPSNPTVSVVIRRLVRLLESSESSPPVGRRTAFSSELVHLPRFDGGGSSRTDDAYDPAAAIEERSSPCTARGGVLVTLPSLGPSAKAACHRASSSDTCPAEPVCSRGPNDAPPAATRYATSLHRSPPRGERLRTHRGESARRGPAG